MYKNRSNLLPIIMAVDSISVLCWRCRTECCLELHTSSCGCFSSPVDTSLMCCAPGASCPQQTSERWWMLSVSLLCFSSEFHYLWLSSVSVCLLATSLTNYWLDLHENFTSNVSINKKEMAEMAKSFWKLPASGSRCRNFFKDFEYY